VTIGIEVVGMLRFPPGIENSGNLCFATSILQVLLNQQVFRKIFACLVNLHKNYQECESGETHHTRHLSTGKTYYTRTNLSMCSDPGKCAISAMGNLEKGYIYDTRKRILKRDHVLSFLVILNCAPYQFSFDYI